MGLASAVTVDGLTTGAANSLVLNPGAVLQVGQLTNAGSVILAGGTLTLQGPGTSVNSGSIQTVSGGGPPSQLGGNITNSGTIGIADGTALVFTGGSTYTNNGQIALNAGSGSSTLLLAGGGTVTLGGSGSLSMSNSLNNGIVDISGGMTLVNGAGHSITGAGVIGAAGAGFTFDNQGTVTASGSAGMVFTPTATVVNGGTIQATGGQLQFLGGAINTGGTIRADGQQVSFTGAVPVVGGTLDVINGGNMVFQGTQVVSADLHVGPGAGTSILNGAYNLGSIDVQGQLTLAGGMIAGSTVTNSGTIQTVAGGAPSQLGGNITNSGTIGIADGTALVFTGGSTYTNNGQIALNAGSGNSALLLTGGGTVTLGGSGSLTMSNSLNNAILAVSGGMTLVNGAGHSISGAGVIGAGGSGFAFDNQGTVTAGGSAGMIFTPGAAVVNGGTIQATGGQLQFLGGALNVGGTIRADGQQVSFAAGAPVVGGALDVINGGNMVFQGTQVLNADLHVGPGAGSAMQNGATYTGGSIDVQGQLTLAGGTIAGSTVTNSGSIQTVAGGAPSQLGGNITNNGTIGIADGTALVFTGGSTYTNNGQIALNAGSGNSALLLTGGGTVTLGGSGSLTMSNSLNNAIVDVSGGMTLVNGAGHSITGAGVIGGGGSGFTFDNQGTVTASGSAGMIFTPGAAFQNNGTLAVNAGSQVFVAGPFSNFASQTLTGGTYDLAGLFQFTGADIATNAADIILDGAGRIVDQFGADGLRDFAANSGSFTMENGASLPSLGQFTNSGSMAIGAGTTLQATGYTQAGGATIVNGTLDADVTLNGGSLSGTGHVTGSVVNTAGNINPGNSPGTLYFDTSFEQGPAGILNMEIGPSGFDRLIVGGAATLGGTLNILLASGYYPLYGQTFSIMEYASYTGEFAHVDLPNPWSVLIYGDHDLSFEYRTPEPASWLMLAGGLGWILRRRVRRGQN